MNDRLDENVRCWDCGIPEPLDTLHLYSGGATLCLGCAEDDTPEVAMTVRLNLTIETTHEAVPLADGTYRIADVGEASVLVPGDIVVAEAGYITGLVDVMDDRVLCEVMTHEAPEPNIFDWIHNQAHQEALNRIVATLRGRGQVARSNRYLVFATADTVVEAEAYEENVPEVWSVNIERVGNLIYETPHAIEDRGELVPLTFERALAFANPVPVTDGVEIPDTIPDDWA